jgi:phospholipid/cholesterol/gamma-HCH transport system permease protein
MAEEKRFDFAPTRDTVEVIPDPKERERHIFIVMEREKIEHAGYALHLEGDKNGEVTLSVSGKLVLGNLKKVMEDIRSLLEDFIPSEITIDLAGLEYLDSAGAVALLQTEKKAKDKSLPFRFINMDPATERIIGLLKIEEIYTEPLVSYRAAKGFFEEVGETSRSILRDIKQLITFLGELLFVFWHALRHPRFVRWGEVLFYMKRAGVDSLPIVGFVNFLLGFVVAVMAAHQLAKYEFSVFLGSLVAIAMVKMFGPLMTAILLAGRTGSAFAAEIGTMVVDEEVNALISMGFDPAGFLTFPKIVATVFVLPLLVLYADLAGVLGGLVIARVDMDMAAYTYFSEMPTSISLFDLLWSLLKTVVFAVIISGVGCQRGFSVRGGAEAVGKRTTSAAVTSIFLIILVDTAFALVVRYIR